MEWYTPPALFDSLGLRFDLDAAAPLDGIPWVPADYWYSEREDGTTKPWFGRVWLNPPYGPKAARFVDRMIEHGHGLLLLPTRTETRVFQRAATVAGAVCFLRDRLHFIRQDGFQARSSFASVLFAFGDDCVDALVEADLGWTLTR